MTIAQIISNRIGIAEKQVAAVLSLLDEGATVPFIARYRKERTGSMDEMQIAAVMAEQERLEELIARKQTILRTIEEQGKLTDALQKLIDDTWDAATIEDL